MKIGPRRWAKVFVLYSVTNEDWTVIGEQYGHIIFPPGI